MKITQNIQSGNAAIMEEANLTLLETSYVHLLLLLLGKYGGLAL
jgi:hypothetical protein